MPDFLDIIGQDKALSLLQRASAGQRRPHAYIFAGPKGVGRRTTAVEFARLLLCEQPARRPNDGRLSDLPEELELRLACGACPSCRTSAAGTNPGLVMIYKELARYHDDPKVRERKMQELSIQIVRDFLIAPAQRASAGGRGKVFIVVGAELMSVPAQNALLKTLEEPPTGVTIILLATSAADLLATTRSRCQLVRFAPLPVDFVASRLAAEGVGPGEAKFWAAMTGGSLGAALALAAEGVYEFKTALVSALAGGGAGDLADMLTKAMESDSRRRQRADNMLAASVASRQAGQRILGLLDGVYRDGLTIAAGAQRPRVHADQAAEIDRIAQRFGPAGCAEVLTQLARYEQLLWQNVNPKLLWCNVAVTCTSAAPMHV